jgi:hypothetical protein
LLGGLLLGCLLVTLSLTASAQDKTKTPAGKDKTGKPMTPAAPATPTPPEPFKLTIVAKSQDVPEMVKFINTKLEENWKANSITPSPYVNDFEFIRRASLDIIGRTAKVEEIAEFLKDPKETRRSKLIERLLESPDYARHWADMWTNWLLSRAGIFGRGLYHDQMSGWLKDQFAENKPYDQMVKELLTAKGKNSDNGAVNFFLAHLGERNPANRKSEEGEFEMVPITSRITRMFLATQVQCAQCHDHPFTNAIKQNHFWGVNAFLRQVERVGNIPMQRQDGLMTLELKDNPSVNEKATVFFEKRNGVVLQTKAEFLPSGEKKTGPRLPPGTVGLDRRVELANYLIEHENFSKAIVNRIWSIFYGRGFTNPIDDFNDQNQPSNPELLNEVSARFKHYGYDLKKLIRWIANTNAYNLSAVANSTNDKTEQEGFFSRMIMKSLTPEQLFESLMVSSHGDSLNTEEKKKLREDWLGKLVSNFGDDEGNEVNFNGTVVQALLMMNGKDLNDSIIRPNGTVAMAMRKGAPPAIITDLYLTALNRKPSPREINSVYSKFPLYRGVVDRDRAAPYQDLFWALLNSNEFILNH